MDINSSNKPRYLPKVKLISLFLSRSEGQKG